MCIVQCVDVIYRSGTFHFVHVASRQILFSQVRNKQAFLLGFPFIDCVQNFLDNANTVGIGQLQHMGSLIALPRPAAGFQFSHLQ